MSVRATVLTPTFNHGPLLEHAVRSVMAQTVRDWELFIIGDGVPDVTHQLVAKLQREDDRIRFFDHPKGPRHGEIYRHEALAEARGEFICYLSDDDLWWPDHLEDLFRLLTHADWAHSFLVKVAANGDLVPRPRDFALAATRKRLFDLHSGSGVGLSASGHRLDMYRRLPEGWRTTPAGIATDRWMWSKFAAHPDCRMASGTRPTSLTYPSAWRRDWSLEQRAAELEGWRSRMTQPGAYDEFLRSVLDALARTAAQSDADKYEREAKQQRKLAKLQDGRKKLQVRAAKLTKRRLCAEKPEKRVAKRAGGFISPVSEPVTAAAMARTKASLWRRLRGRISRWLRSRRQPATPE
jgi:glycosyltransferase involved in cell wall biosynthesis